MPMEPNRTRQALQDLARTFNKLASELTADLSYAAREIERLQARVTGLTEAQRNHRLMEQRRVARPTRIALPIQEPLTAQQPSRNRPNRLTSRDHSSFRRSLSAQALHLSPSLKETTEAAS